MFIFSIIQKHTEIFSLFTNNIIMIETNGGPSQLQIKLVYIKKNY